MSSITFEYRGPYLDGQSESEYGHHVVEATTIPSNNAAIGTSFSPDKIVVNINQLAERMLEKNIKAFVPDGIYGANTDNFNLLTEKINLYFRKCYSPITITFSNSRANADFELNWIEGTSDELSAHGTVTFRYPDIPLIRISKIINYRLLPVVLLHEIGNLFGLSDRVECSKNLMAKQVFNNSIRLTPAQILDILEYPNLEVVPDLNIFPLV